jgi:MFS family permease
MSSIRSVFSLLLTTALLLAGHGLHMTFLPLRASELGLSADWVGFSGGAYFSGFIWGALVIPPIIARVGHIRSFTALMATFLCSFLLLSLTSSGLLWVLIRFALGAAMCGAYTVIESWLADQSEPEQHGRIFSIYTLVVLAAMAAGQYLLQIMPENPLMPFITVALLVGLAIIPVSLTRSLAPAPVPATRFNFGKLYRRSHTAFAGALGSGMIMGSFWTLGAIYALNVTQDPSIVPTFVAATIIGGAVAQYPIGVASDSIDRRFVLAALCALCCVASLLLTAAQTTTVLLSAAVLFGVGGSSLYAVSLAKAADNSRRDEFLTIGSSVLLLNALGAAIGSFLFGWIMRAIAAEALFFSVAVVSALVGLYISLQPRGDSAVEVEDQSQFVAATSAMAPAALAQDPRNEQEPITISPEPELADPQD